jgi:hypothetical protein
MGVTVRQRVKGSLMISLFSIIFLVALSSPSQAQEPLVLDCAVTKLSPVAEHLFENSPAMKTIILSERYQITIYPGRAWGKVSTSRLIDIPARITESERYYRIEFRDFQIDIDRMTGEFQERIKSAQGYIASGICRKLGERKF